MAARSKAGVWDAEVLVAGAGAWGSMAAWQLAAAGLKVLVLDRFSPPHEFGSSHGLTRLFRTACLEHPGLTPIAITSLELYRELERRTGEPIIELTGGLTIGSESGRAMPGALRAAQVAGLEAEVLDRDAIAARFPFHGELREDDLGVLDPLSGVLRIETAVRAALDTAIALGARLRTGVQVRDILRIPGGYRVSTSAGTFRAPKVVAALGSWSKDLFPEIPQKITRMPMTWFEPVDGDAGEAAALGNTGVFIREIDGIGGYWGHGAPAGEPAKVGPRGTVARGDEGDLDRLDRVFAPADGEAATRAVRQYLPALTPSPRRGFICHSTRTPDEQFVIGEPVDRPGLVLACGESGHGAKHAAGIGRIVADLIQETDPGLELDFVSPLRFHGARAATT